MKLIDKCNYELAQRMYMGIMYMYYSLISKSEEGRVAAQIYDGLDVNRRTDLLNLDINK